jgi:hypothetical protein
VKAFFREKGFGLQGEIPSGNTPKRFPDMYLLPHTGWEISEDGTVREPMDTGYDPEKMFPQYGYFGFEISTPVLRHCQASFDHVHEVITATNSKFRVRTNPTCGMHCHVGAGTQLIRNPEGGYLMDSDLKKPVFKSWTFSLQDLRRISALVWVADPFLATLHPPERQINEWSPSILLVSILAKGRCGESTKKFSTPILEKDLDKKPTKPTQRISYERFLATRSKTVPDDAVERRKMITSFKYDLAQGKTVLDRVFPGADMLLSATSKAQIAEMLHKTRASG